MLLDVNQIKSRVNCESCLIEVFDEIDSTNEYLRKLPPNDNKLTICLSEAQTNGHGRFNRPWNSSAGKDICLSIKYGFNKSVSVLSGLSLVCGLAVCRALDNVYKLEPKLYTKWPNDVFVEDKKLGGILIEVQTDSSGMCSAVIGIGLNVNSKSDNWASVSGINGLDNDRNILVAELINQVEHYIDKFAVDGLEAFVAEWEGRDYLLGKAISLKSGKDVVTGVGAGINSDGHLLLQLADGNVQSFCSGDTTLHGV